ncbi:MAG TPA: hypothetical protein VNZ03_36365 [Terriglobales bacterium]|jgi:hypothetical protein|nr:hypothetical protein [Terriglobales bacterium]
MLSLVQPAAAKIVYTKTHHVIRPNHSYVLDLNHDGVTDLSIENTSSCGDWCGFTLVARAVAGNAVVGENYYASALTPGADIGPKQPFSGLVMAHYTNGFGSHSGRWGNVTNRYLGLKFRIKGKTHYGWARLNVSDHQFGIVAPLTGYAYETIPNKSIIAGKTKGPGDSSVEQRDATLTMPPLPPASLGILALGAPGRSIWRREESVGYAVIR